VIEEGHAYLRIEKQHDKCSTLRKELPGWRKLGPMPHPHAIWAVAAIA